jgi:hypothetical protein
MTKLKAHKEEHGQRCLHGTRLHFSLFPLSPYLVVLAAVFKNFSHGLEQRCVLWGVDVSFCLLQEQTLLEELYSRLSRWPNVKEHPDRRATC